MIKRQLFVITIFLSNIVLTTTVSADTIEAVRNILVTQAQHQEAKKSLHSLAVTYLINKGLEASVARERVAMALNHSEEEARLLAQKIVQRDGMGYDDIVAYVANAALHKKQVDLGSHDEIVALMQRKV